MLPVPHLRVAFDLVALVVACYLLARAWRSVRPVAFAIALGGVVATVVASYGAVERGVRTAIHVDLAYASLVLVLAVSTRGDFARLAPASYLRTPDEGTHRRVRLGPVGIVAFIGSYFLVDYLAFGTILA